MFDMCSKKNYHSIKYCFIFLSDQPQKQGDMKWYFLVSEEKTHLFHKLYPLASGEGIVSFEILSPYLFSTI